MTKTGHFKIENGKFYKRKKKQTNAEVKEPPFTAQNSRKRKELPKSVRLQVTTSSQHIAKRCLRLKVKRKYKKLDLKYGKSLYWCVHSVFG